MAPLRHFSLWFYAAMGFGYAVAYGLFFHLADYFVGLVSFSLWFPAAGLRFAILLIVGWPFAIVVAVVEILTHRVIGAWSIWGDGRVWQLIAGVSTPPLIYGAVIWFFVRAVGMRADSLRLSNIAWLCTAALVAPAVAAPISTTFQHLAGLLPAQDFWQATLSFWVGDSIGVLMLAPPVTVAWLWVRNRRQRPQRPFASYFGAFHHWGIAPREQRGVEVAIGVLLIAALYWFATSTAERYHWYAAFLPVIWLALRFGMLGAVAAVTGTNLLAGWVAYQLHGPAQQIDLQLFLIALSLTGLFLGAIVSDRVVTAERHARQLAKLARADRLNALSTLSAAIVHEIGQPATTLLSYAREAARRAGEGRLSRSDLESALDSIVGEADRLQQIVESVRRLGQSDRQRREPVDINDAINRVLPLLRVDARENGVRLEASLVPELPKVSADPVQVEQVILNLGRNGIHAVADAGAADERLVTVATGATQDGVAITVRDSGRGFDADAADTLFEPFSGTEAEGLGLGLAISKAIVDQHGGRLRAAAESGRGATFTVELPRSGAS